MNCRYGLLIIKTREGKKLYEKKKCFRNTSTRGFVADLDDCQPEFLSKAKSNEVYRRLIISNKN